MAKAGKTVENTSKKIEDQYIDFVLTHGGEPKSVYDFAKKSGMQETDFYRYYSSFEAIEKTIWSNFTTETILGVSSQEIWPQYSAREKVLSFFYAFVELLKSKRSYVVYTFKKYRNKVSTPSALHDAKNIFEVFAESVVNEGLDTKELADRKLISKRYKDALWLQYLFIVKFWADDDSKDFEKTDEAIEKGVNVTFDLFQQSALDNMLEYGKFLFRNSRLKERMKL